MPEGTLTPAQYEIMEVVWDAGRAGASVAEVWQAVSTRRGVARTTVLNLVDRLEKRGWLRRKEQDGANRYVATVTKDRTNSALASGRCPFTSSTFAQMFVRERAGNVYIFSIGSPCARR